MSENPYRPPTQDLESGALLHRHALIDIVRSWEKLRILYNLILLLPGLGILFLQARQFHLSPLVAVVEALVVAAGANFAFLLGPAAELYFRALFRRGESIGRGRLLIFGAGLVVSAGVFLIALLMSTL
jgi:hypothetical protein